MPQIESLFSALGKPTNTTEYDQLEIEPDEEKFVTLPTRNDDESRKLTASLPFIQRREGAIYSMVVFRYRYKGMPEGMVRITENCQWFSGNPDTNAWVNCWNRTYDIRE
jgi:hypothetical protein